MHDYKETIIKAAIWISIPVWLPLYVVTIPPARYSANLWRKHVGPLKECAVHKPVARQRTLRRNISLEALDKAQESADSKDSNSNSKSVVVAAKGSPKDAPPPLLPPCGFWKLPIELRLMIWKELLRVENDDPVEVTLLTNKPNRVNLYSYACQRSVSAKILRCMNILYQETDFRMRGEATLRSFARRVAPSRLAQIRSLHFAVCHHMYKSGDHRRSLTFNSGAWKETCEELKLFTGLKQLRITLKMDIGGIWGRCRSDPVWREKFFSFILDPLTDIKVADGGEFTVGYTWLSGVCDTWPKGTFTMKHVEETYDWWDERYLWASLHPLVRL